MTSYHNYTEREAEEERRERCHVKPGSLRQFNKLLDKLRLKAAMSLTGCVVVSIEELNAIEKEYRGCQTTEHESNDCSTTNDISIS